MGKEILISKLICIKCKSKKIERVDDFFSSSSDPRHDRILQTIMCEDCGWVGISIYRLELVYAGEEHGK